MPELLNLAGLKKLILKEITSLQTSEFDHFASYSGDLRCLGRGTVYGQFATKRFRWLRYSRGLSVSSSILSHILRCICRK